MPALESTPCPAIPPATIHCPHWTREHLNRYAFDEDYLARLERGDAEIEGHFASYFGELLLIKLQGRLRNSQLAADLRQETFVRVFQAVRERKAVIYPERLGSFVNSVCENVLLEYFRSAKATEQMDDEIHTVADRACSVESDLITEEQSQIVRKVLAEMPHTDQVLLKGLFLEERDKDQLCRELHIDRNNLRVRLHRALARFRSYLNTQEHAAVAKMGRRGV